MKFHVDGNQIDPSLVIYRELGFGERLEPEGSLYTFELSLNEIGREFYDVADSFIEQCRRDDEKQEVSDIPELEKVGYLSSKTLLAKSPKIFESLIADYLYFDFLGSVFKGAAADGRFVINSIEIVTVTGSKILVSGRGFFREK